MGFLSRKRLPITFYFLASGSPYFGGGFSLYLVESKNQTNEEVNDSLIGYAIRYIV